MRWRSLIESLIYESASPAPQYKPKVKSGSEKPYLDQQFATLLPLYTSLPLQVFRIDMGDPLSVASGVAGLVSLGLSLCNGLHKYFSAIKDRHTDVEFATQTLALLQLNIYIIQ